MTHGKFKNVSNGKPLIMAKIIVNYIFFSFPKISSNFSSTSLVSSVWLRASSCWLTVAINTMFRLQIFFSDPNLFSLKGHIGIHNKSQQCPMSPEVNTITIWPGAAHYLLVLTAYCLVANSLSLSNM